MSYIIRLRGRWQAKPYESTLLGQVANNTNPVNTGGGGG